MAKADTAKKQRQLTVEIPRPGDEQPVWSRVGVIAVVGFLIGIAWPKIAGVRIGPGVPGDLKATTEPVASSAAAPVGAAGAGLAAPAEPSGKEAEAPENSEQVVVIGPGKIIRCFDDADKKLDDCGELQFDPVALPRLKELARCPSAVGLEGNLAIGFELNFAKKEVQVAKGKKTTLPASTVTGILKCAAREFSNVGLDEVPHKYRRYSLVYSTTFYPPGKRPELPTSAEAGKTDGEKAAGTTTSETSATGAATVSWDTALVRQEPKEGEVVMRLVRGTRVQVVGRQNDWYKVAHRGKVGWVYRGSIGL